MRVATGYAGLIHLLLTDVVMPGASGHDLAQQLGLQRPAMKVLSKPFTIERLTEKVRERCSPQSRPLPLPDRPIPGEMSRP